MFANVLVGVDGRSNGRDAVALAAELADEGTKVTFGHVHSSELHPLHAITPGQIREEREASHRLLERESQNAGISAELISIVADTPGHGLHEQAEEQGAELLVVGSSERTALSRVMLGDDARAALNGAPCAVAVAARGYAEHPSPVARIGVAYNGSPESLAALEAARSLAESRNASLVALEVVGLPSYAYMGTIPPVTGESIDTMLAEAQSRLGALPGVEGRSVYGLAGEELAAFGNDVDLLIVGSRSYGPWKRLVLGSTSNYLQRHARCSLLVLPRGDR
jgi:nucleotide-binding universal stress UspA family protein